MNYQEGMAEKINTRFEFPEKLEFKNYCIETEMDGKKEDIYKKKDEYYEYDLKGINIHRGNAEGGHYVSLIKIRNDKDEGEYEDKWYEFNDSFIREIELNEAYLEEECFGGKKENSDEEKHHNAYLLFYELKKKKPIKIMINEREEIEKKSDNENLIEIDKNNQASIEKQYDVTKLSNPYNEKELVKKIFYDKDEDSYYKYISYDDIVKKIPKEYLMEVIEDNQICDFLNGKGRVIDFNNYLLNILLDCFESNVSNTINFKANLNLIDISISAIFSCLTNVDKKTNSDNIQKILIIINNIILPSLQNYNNNEKSELLQHINCNLFNINGLKLIFNNKNIENDIPEKIYELLNQIIKLNNKENNESLLLIVYKVIIDEDKISNYLYNILFLLIKEKKFKNKETLAQIFLTLYYKLYKENCENLKIIYKIFEYIIYDQELFKKEVTILKEIKLQFNDRTMKVLFEKSPDILILLVKQLQYNDKKYSNDFNINFIQKLYLYCEKSLVYDDKIKLIRFIFSLLEIIDKYTFYRIKILMGYPSMIIKKSKDNEVPLFGLNLLKKNNLDQEIFEYINYNHIRKQRCILALLFPNSDDNNENILKEKDRLDLIYELIQICLGLDDKKGGNYFLFKYIYLMQTRKIIYDNLYIEMKQLLENANKVNNNKYDLSIFKSNEKKCISLINSEYDENYNLINLICNIDPTAQHNKKYFSKLFLPDCFHACNEFLDENVNKEYLGLVSDIIPHKIRKIKINRIASNDNLSILRMEYFTTYFTRKELMTLSEEKNDFIYENIRRNENKEKKN